MSPRKAKKKTTRQNTRKSAPAVSEQAPQAPQEQAVPVAEEWILCRSVHLGQVRDSFGAGTIIEHLVSEKKLRINGVEYDGDNDLRALISLSQKTGQTWVARNTVEAREVAASAAPALAKDKADLESRHKPLPVVKSDADEIEPIDISHTKNRPTEHKKNKDAPLEVVRDETSEERLARLQSHIPKMPVVENPGLGRNDARGPALNAGQVRSRTPEQIKADREAALAKIRKVSPDTEALPTDVEVASLPPVAEKSDDMPVDAIAVAGIKRVAVIVDDSSPQKGTKRARKVREVKEVKEVQEVCEVQEAQEVQTEGL